jgi:T5SS/PEP-CTERM-associated repeat protein
VGTLSINNGGSYTGAPVLGVASVGQTDAAGFVYVQGSGSTWAIPGSYVLGAGAGPVTVNVNTNGTVTSGDVGIGQVSAGQLQIDGSASSWTSSGTITVGTGAKGRINLSNGGSVSAAALVVNAQGGVNATFNNSIQAANVTINNGFVQIGSGTFTTGSTTIPAGGIQLTNSNWTNSGSLYVGGDSLAAGSGSPAGVSIVGGSATVSGILKVWGPGQVTIDGNANVGLHDVDIEGGSLDVPSGQVSGNGGSMTVAGHGEYSLSMGDFNGNDFPSVTVNGALFNIQNGAITLHATQSLVATNGSYVVAGSGGVQVKSGATLSLADSTLTASSLDVYGGLTLSNATVNVNDFNLDGGTITALGPLPVQSEIRGFGTIAGNVQLAGGALNARGGALAVTGDISGYGVLVGAVSSATLTPTGKFVLSGNKNELGSQSAVLVSSGPAHLNGVLTSDGGTLTSASGIAIDAAGVMSGSITVHGDLTNDGLLDVGGDQIGLDAIYGNLTLDPSGTIRVQVGGTDPSDYDQIMVKNGNVSLGGTLDLEFVNGFLPKQGDQFNIFIDDFSGSFSNVEVSGLGDWNYTVAGGPTGVTLNSMSDAVAVPEPGAPALLALSIPGVLWLRRRGARRNG